MRQREYGSGDIDVVCGIRVERGALALGVVVGDEDVGVGAGDPAFAFEVFQPGDVAVVECIPDGVGEAEFLHVSVARVVGGEGPRRTAGVVDDFLGDVQRAVDAPEDVRNVSWVDIWGLSSQR